jgi:hypothetical protein
MKCFFMASETPTLGVWDMGRTRVQQIKIPKTLSISDTESFSVDCIVIMWGVNKEQ